MQEDLIIRTISYLRFFVTSNSEHAECYIQIELTVYKMVVDL